ncbi:response regulator transcription factor [Cryobacterium frigoriphilum]|uniref:Response regulator transcription factor n=1 Tax=Cryobacterium frigoriphilum TaxID=1259150 RepID=A0A4R8ZT98_9MICO|nr:response regulator transcription factor [Cryobacterium frigoriphilum]TFD44814.1 response regulator transcription factor [Cryobacterium frigoriphilum]
MTSSTISPHACVEPRPRVLVVDDELPLLKLVAGYLERDGFDVETAADGRSAVTKARDWAPAIIVLDLGLPVMDGTEVCRTVRTFSDSYIIMLTARVDEIDKLVGLSVGADDYLTKPFSPRELVARVRVMLRRPRPSEQAEDLSTPPLVFKSLQIDIAGREVHRHGQPVDLTRTEFDVLAVLAGQPRLVFSRQQLIEAVWGGGWMSDPHLVDVHIGHVRRKIGDDPSASAFIRTVRGIGYQMGAGA